MSFCLSLFSLFLSLVISCPLLFCHIACCRCCHLEWNENSGRLIIKIWSLCTPTSMCVVLYLLVLALDIVIAQYQECKVFKWIALCISFYYVNLCKSWIHLHSNYSDISMVFLHKTRLKCLLRVSKLEP